MSKKPQKETQPRKTYQFRIYPTHKQVNRLEEWLGVCCEIYNAALDERKSAYRMAGVSLCYQHQCAELPQCKEVRADLSAVPSQVLHRAIKGTPKPAIVKRTPTGKWFVSISVELEEELPAQRLLPLKEAVGIDVGLKTFAYLSTGEEIANPRFFRTEEAALTRAQRKLSKAPKGSKQRAKKRKVVARVHERIGNRRKNFLEQEVCKLIKRFGLLAVEALVVRNMMRNPKLAKSIADVSWSQFFARLQAKAEEAGRQVVRVNPAYTIHEPDMFGVPPSPTDAPFRAGL